MLSHFLVILMFKNVAHKNKNPPTNLTQKQVTYPGSPLKITGGLGIVTSCLLMCHSVSQDQQGLTGPATLCTFTNKRRASTGKAPEGCCCPVVPKWHYNWSERFPNKNERVVMYISFVFRRVQTCTRNWNSTMNETVLTTSLVELQPRDSSPFTENLQWRHRISSTFSFSPIIFSFDLGVTFIPASTDSCNKDGPVASGY